MKKLLIASMLLATAAHAGIFMAEDWRPWSPGPILGK